jgi:hypothetical protein
MTADPKPRRGRPPTFGPKVLRKQFSLYPEQFEKALRLGNGQASAGVQRALDALDESSLPRQAHDPAQPSQPSAPEVAGK